MPRALGLVFVLSLAWSNAAAQDSSTFQLHLTRPDAQPEALPGRLLDEAPEAPAADANVQTCGGADIWLRKLQYRNDGLFNYFYVLRRSRTSAWEEWVVPRSDRGRFQPQTVDNVEVVLTEDAEPACRSFRVPLYCVGSCGEMPWWALAGDEPKTLTIYLSAGGYWDLVFKPLVTVPAKIAAPQFTIQNLSTERWTINLTPNDQIAGQLALGITPHWSEFSRLFSKEQGLTARLTYRSEAADRISEGISLQDARVFTVILKPDPWLLPLPMLVGMGFAFLVRRLAWNDIKRPLRELGVVSVVGLVFLIVGYLTGTAVEIAGVNLDPDGLNGAGVIGFTTGLSGRAAVKRLRQLFGLPEDS